MKLRKTAAIVSALAAAVLGSVVAGGVAHAVPGECPELNVIAIPGTWETSTKPDAKPGPGMLAAVTKGLPDSARVDYVTYPATAFPWEGEVYGASKGQAVDSARAMIAATAAQCGSTRFALVGYSQGADAAGDLAAEIGTGLGVVPPDRIAAVGLLSDPRRSATDALVGPPVVGDGASGPRVGGFGWVTPNVRTICAVGDLYCSTPKDDFVSRMAGFLVQTSGASPQSYDEYRAEAGAIYHDLLSVGGMPVLQDQLTDQANRQRVTQVRTFYQSSVHQDYGRYAVDGEGRPATAWLNDWLRSKV